MVRALCRKEWMQLGLLRWAGFVLGLLVPPGLVALSAFFAQRKVAFAAVSDSSFAQLLGTPAAALYAVLWGLLALMVGGQVFSADRGAGTDGFLSERPVGRRAVWGAKVATGLLAVAALAVAHGGYLWALRILAGAADATGPLLDDPSDGLLLPAVTILLGFAAGAAGAALVRPPMHALLVGMVLALLPLGLAAVWVQAFPFAWVGPVALGVLAPALLIPGYLVVSWFAETRGEPAGRRRPRRALIGLVAALAVSAGTLVFAPLAVRAGAATNARVELSADGRFVILDDPRGGFLIDLETDERRFFSPPLHGMSWSDRGSWLAVWDSTAQRRWDLGRGVRFLDAATGRWGAEVDLGEGTRWSFRSWAGDRLVAHDGETWLIVDPRSGIVGRFGGVARPAGDSDRWSRFPEVLVDPRDHRVYALLPCPDDPVCRNMEAADRGEESGAATQERPATAIAVHEVDLETARIREDPSSRILLRVWPRPRPWHSSLPWIADRRGRWVHFETGESLAWERQGRSWMTKLGSGTLAVESGDSRALRVVDLATGELVVDRTWPDRRVWIRNAPDGQSFLARVFRPTTGKANIRPDEHWWFDAETRAMKRLDAVELPGRPKTQWAADHVLAVELPDSWWLYDVRDGSSRRIER